jgi:hypothetical protein
MAHYQGELFDGRGLNCLQRAPPSNGDTLHIDRQTKQLLQIFTAANSQSVAHPWCEIKFRRRGVSFPLKLFKTLGTDQLANFNERDGSLLLFFSSRCFIAARAQYQIRGIYFSRVLQRQLRLQPAM